MATARFYSNHNPLRTVDGPVPTDCNHERTFTVEHDWDEVTFCAWCYVLLCNCGACAECIN